MISAAEQEKRNILFYKEPAEDTAEALPLGNGRFMVLVSGAADNECLTLQHEAFWSGYPGCARQEADFTSFYSQEARAERSALGERLKNDAGSSAVFEQRMKAVFPAASPESFLYPGQLWLRLEQPEGSELALYEQSLNLAEAVHRCQYTFAGGTGEAAFPLREYRRECFVAKNDDYLAMRWESLDKAPMNLALYFASPFRSELLEQVFRENSAMSLLAVHGPDSLPLAEHESLTERSAGRLPNRKSKRLILGILLRTEGEKVTFAGAKNGLALNGVTGFTLYLVLRSEALDSACEQTVRNSLAELAQKTYEACRQSHCEAFGAAFASFDIRLASSLGKSSPQVMTDTKSRLIRFRHAPVFRDAEFYSLLVRYARYLALISLGGSSFPLFADGRDTACQSQKGRYYHLADDFAFAYGAIGPLGLAEEAQPMLKKLAEFVGQGQAAAAEIYGCKGAVCHAVSDYWAYADPAAVDSEESLKGCWPLGLAVLCDAAAKILLYLPVEKYLAEYLHFLRELDQAAGFFCAYMKQDENGRYYMAPVPLSDAEPEKQKLYARTAEAQGIIYSLFKTYADMAAQLLRNNIDPQLPAEAVIDEVMRLSRAIAVPLRAAKEGCRAEWEAYAGAESREGVYLSAFKTLSQLNSFPEEVLLSGGALQRALQRLPENDETLLRRSYYLSCVQDGDRALRLIKKAVSLQPGLRKQSGIGSNLLFDTAFLAPEGNLALAWALLNLFIREQDGVLELLPALPLDIGSGEIKGYRHRSGLIINFVFKEREPESLELINPSSVPLEIQLLYRRRGRFKTIIPAGETKCLTGEEIRFSE